jgi:hypothetical protein
LRPRNYPFMGLETFLSDPQSMALTFSHRGVGSMIYVPVTARAPCWLNLLTCPFQILPLPPPLLRSSSS